jgi:signal transduction histidine kinase
MLSKAVEDSRSNRGNSEVLSQFCADMAEGLHGLAQPLTILRTAVAAAGSARVDASGQRRYLDISTQQMERACSLFECLQDLVIAHQTEADCEPFDLLALLAPVIEDQRVVLRAEGTELRIIAPAALPHVLGDVARTLQPLFAALKIAASVASPGGAVELTITAGTGFIDLTIESRATPGRPLNSSERLSLALAAANIRSQQGGYQCSEHPFRVSIQLKLGAFPGPAASNRDSK